MQDNGPKILVVDDDADLRWMVEKYLSKHEFSVTLAEDGVKMREALEQQSFDLAILDINLPGEDGLSLARYLRSNYQIGIIMLSAAAEVFDRIVGLEMGADDYVTKPFNPREVVARIKAILRRSQPVVEEGSAEVLRVDGLTLDVQSHRVSNDGASVDLTPSEFDILQLLMRHPGQAFSRTQIIDQGLGYEYAGLERTVDSHIKNLRRKLEADPKEPRLIETVFGVGYRLNVTR